MFLKKYWKSNLFFIIFIFLFTLFDVYINNYPMSIYKNMLNDYFGLMYFHIFLFILYLLLLLTLLFFYLISFSIKIKMILCLFNINN